MRHLLKIGFTDFWYSFNENDNFILNILKEKYRQIEIVHSPEEETDILFYSCFGFRHYCWPSQTIKVYYTGENDIPNFNECDYAISMSHVSIGRRHFRLPLYLTYANYSDLCAREQWESGGGIVDDARLLKRDFCSVVMSAADTCDPVRLEIIDKVDSYKSVAFGGKYKNNVGGAVKDKIGFIGNYKFNLAIENSAVSGYMTEKISEAFTARTVPIYWGAPDCHLEFNSKAYIDVSSFATLDEACEFVKEVNEDDNLYLSILHEPIFSPSFPYRHWETSFLDFLSYIVETRKKETTEYGQAGVNKKKQFLKDSFFSHHKLRKFLTKLNEYIQPNYRNI